MIWSWQECPKSCAGPFPLVSEYEGVVFGGLEKGANVVAGFFFDRDGEAGVSGNVEGGAGGDFFRACAPIEHVVALSSYDFHHLGSFGAKVVFTREDDAEGFLGAIGQDDAVGDDFAVEVNIGSGECGDVFVLHSISLKIFQGLGWWSDRGLF